MSTSSAEAGPSGRPSTSEAPHGPINLFDTHLRFLTDSYLSFFQERYYSSPLVPIATYHYDYAERRLKRHSEFLCLDNVNVVLTLCDSVEALLKLHRRCKTTDIYLNGGHDVPYSTRKVWDEVRDNVDRGTCTITYPLILVDRDSAEADTRKAFMESLTVEVINPLVALKVRAAMSLIFAQTYLFL